MTGPPPPTACEGVADDLVLFAAGTLAGPARSEVLEHLARCPDCGGELGQYAAVADALLGLGDGVEPPAGFEVRALERMGVTPIVRRQRRWPRRVLAAAAAVVLLAAGTAFGAALATGGPAPATTPATPRSATLAYDGTPVGRVTTSGGSQPWMVVALRPTGWDQTVTCEAVLHDGRRVRIGTFWVGAGASVWGVALPVPAAAVHRALVVDAQGDVLASADVGG